MRARCGKFVAVFASFALLLAFTPAFSQSNIRNEKLKDGVERWYRAQAVTAKPWFFQQVENLFTVALPAKEQLPFGKSVAFLVGVSQYDYLRPQLPFVENDLRDMREFLLHHGGFDTVYVAANKIATRDLVDDYMSNRFRKSLGSRDRLLFYYSGHGADVGGATGYMQFGLAQSDDVVRNVLAINRCMEWSSIIKAGHILFLYDCCASGLAFDAKSGSAEAVQKLITSLSGEGSRMVITAGTAEEKTYEVKDGAGRGNGVFTRAFLDAVASGVADERKSGFTTINEVFAQTERGVKKFAAIYNKKLSPRRWELQESQYRGTFVFLNPTLRNLTLAPEYAQALNATPRSPVVAEYGTIQLRAFLDGKVYIDGVFVDDIASGEEKMYDQRVGSRKVEVRGASETVAQTVQVVKGRITAVTLRPQRATPAITQQTQPGIVPLPPSSFKQEEPKAPPGMVRIPAGSFRMGSNDGDEDEKPIHEVYVDAFFMDETEVTVEQYRLFLNANPNHRKPDNWEEQQQNPKRPVVYVSWEDAKAYATWAGKRLPYEAEWEYAARGGNTGLNGKPHYKYPWGDNVDASKANYDPDGSHNDWRRYLRDVRSYAQNGYGFYDMAGNVWEWCEDSYDANYYKSSLSRNPKNLIAGTLRVLRGGSWINDPQVIRCAVRDGDDPALRGGSLGFRCALDVR